MSDIVGELETVPVAPVTRASEVALAWSLEGSAVAVALLASGLFKDQATRRALDRRARQDVLEASLMDARGGVVQLAATRFSRGGRLADAEQEARLALLSCLRRYDWRVARLDVFAAGAVAESAARAGQGDSRDALAHVVSLGSERVGEASDGATAEERALTSLDVADLSALLGHVTRHLTAVEGRVVASLLSDEPGSVEPGDASEREVVAARLRVGALLRHPGASRLLVGLGCDSRFNVFPGTH